MMKKVFNIAVVILCSVKYLLTLSLLYNIPDKCTDRDNAADSHLLSLAEIQH